MSKTRFRINYGYLDQSNDEKLTEAAVQEMLRSGQDQDSDSDDDNNDDNNVHHCDDLALREEWLKDSNCFFVELDEITFYHTGVSVMGLQAQYRCEYEDSRVITKKGPMHYFAKGCFSFHCGLNSINEIIKLKVTRKDSIITVLPERNGKKGKAVTLSNAPPTKVLSI